jgi:hypothetical protein
MRDLQRVGEILDAIAQRVDADRRDDQPLGGRFDRKPLAIRPKKSKSQFIRSSKNFKPLEGEQMSLFPCIDLFPDTYL